MKKFILLTILSLISFCGFSQKFEGVKITKPIKVIGDYLVETDGYIKKTDCYFLKVRNDSKIEKVFLETVSDSSAICSIEKFVYCESLWTDIYNEFNRQINIISNTEGHPYYESCCFSKRFYESGLSELQGIKNGQCDYYATWNGKAATIYVSIEYQEDIETFVINVEYVNNKTCGKQNDDNS